MAKKKRFYFSENEGKALILLSHSIEMLYLSYKTDPHLSQKFQAWSVQHFGFRLYHEIVVSEINTPQARLYGPRYEKKNAFYATKESDFIFVRLSLDAL